MDRRADYLRSTAKRNAACVGHPDDEGGVMTRWAAPRQTRRGAAAEHVGAPSDSDKIDLIARVSTSRR